MRLIILSLLSVFLQVNYSVGQNSYPKGDFSSPLEIPLYLAGNFAELRSNHFHGGLDIKTQGVEGMKVLAVGDGYVSRIKISAFGYGRALYIRHPNGYTTVYGHLQKFNDEIEAYIKKNQYKKQSFEIELFPSAAEFPLKQGEVVAISGNSGGSSAPHLHFEIRDTRTEAPVNPLLFGFDIKDNISPALTKIYLYPLSDESRINGSIGKKAFSLSGQGGNYKVNSRFIIEAYGKFGFGISLYDQLNEVPNHCGIYEIKLFQNEDLIYHQKMEKIPFHENRYINALTDFEEKTKHGKWIIRNFILPNNRLNIYENQKSNGIIELAEGTTSAFRYEITDTYGNLSTLSLEVTGAAKPSQEEAILAQKPTRYFKYNQPNTYEDDDVLVYLPANVLYEDLEFNYYKEERLPRSITEVFHIHNLYTPLHSYMALSIKVKNIDPSLKKYCTAVSIDGNGGIVPEGGYWRGEYLIVKSRSFGAYTVMVDSSAPKLTPINIFQNANMSRKWSISIRAEDNLSGVNKYNASIDGEWALTEFDYKKKMLIHYFEPNLESGSHHYKLVVKDKIGNETTYECDFIR